jgi:hypothetical protein
MPHILADDLWSRPPAEQHPRDGLPAYTTLMLWHLCCFTRLVSRPEAACD